jgi:UDP-N-acetylmuramoyl-tripeptide--D-alanyl-D-alanine ligase
VVAPVGSFNNELGVPLTILGCDEQTRYCIVEMGARHVGDIALLCELAKPSIGAVLGIGNAHLGEFGSREQIALAKGELIRALPATGTAVLGNYDELAPHLADGLSLKVFTFGESTSCQIRATDVEFRGGASAFELVTPGGRAPVELALIGLHQIANALAAAALAFAAGISTEVIAAGLSMASAESKWRMALSEVGHVVLLNDSYNANPESMSAALKTLALLAQERGGRAWAFLGKMHELGESERQEHLAIGKLASDLGVDHLVSIGTDLFINGLELNPESDELWTHYLLTQEEALGMTKYLLPGDVVLIKASRAEHLDELAEAMTAALLAVEEVI